MYRTKMESGPKQLTTLVLGAPKSLIPFVHWGFPTVWGTFVGGPHNKDVRILGSCGGPPTVFGETTTKTLEQKPAPVGIHRHGV